LGKLKDPRALPALLDALDYYNLRHYAGYDHLWIAIAAYGEAAAAPLAELAGSGPAKRRRGAMEALRRIAHPSSRDVFLDAIKRRDHRLPEATRFRCHRLPLPGRSASVS
jgi:HEAT repeat protein